MSLTGELEAIDNYNQRADVGADMALKAILEHNRDEEKEHAAMLPEWIQRQDSGFSGKLQVYLFSKKQLRIRVRSINQKYKGGDRTCLGSAIETG